MISFRKILHTLAWLVALTASVSADPISIVFTYLAAHEIIAGLVISALATSASYLIQKIASPRPKPGEAPRPDLQLTTSREGEGIPRIYGTGATGGKVIWMGSITTRSVSQGSGKRASPPTTAYSCSLGFLVCENRNDSMLGVSRILVNGDQCYSRDISGLTGANVLEGTPGGPFRADLCNAFQMQIMMGAETQTDRCDWYATTGDDNYPAYRGSVTVWLDNVDLTPTYNQIGQWQFEVVNSDGTITQIVAAECDYAGLSAGQITNGSPPDGPMGYIIDGPTPPKQTFELLSVYSPFSAAEVDGKIKFMMPQPSSATIPDEDLGAIASGREEGDRPVKFSMSSEQSINEAVQRIDITFFEASNNYEEATVGYALQFGSGVATKEISMPMSSTRTKVRNVASKWLARSRTETDVLSLTLPPKYIQYHPGDTLSVPAPNAQVIDFQITNMEFAPSDMCKVEGIRQLRSQGVGSPDEGTSATGDGPVVPPLDTIFILSNAPPLIDDHDGFDGIYWAAGPRAVSTTTPPALWMGATLFRNACGSDDTNKQYYAIALTRTAAVIGKARTALASGTGIDSTNTVDVDFPYGAGTSTVLGIHDDAFTKTTQSNLCILGKEVLQFRDVSDVSASYSLPAGRVWRLSHLKRGIRDTLAMIGTHAISEGFVLWSPDSLIRVPLDIIEQDNTWNFKALTLTQSEAEADPIAFEYDPDDGTMTLWDTP